MESLHVTGAPGKYRLMLRDYFCQGERPDYVDICVLSDIEALDLVSGGRLVEPWFNEKDFAGRSGDPSSCLALVDGEYGSPEVRVRLPAAGRRKKAVDVAVPVIDDVRLALRDPGKAAAFLAKTRIADQRGCGRPAPAPEPADTDPARLAAENVRLRAAVEWLLANNGGIEAAKSCFGHEQHIGVLEDVYREGA
jgi:hypothetical protein